MPDQPVTQDGPILAGNQFLERLLDLLGSCLAREIESLSQSRNMCVDDDAFVDIEGVSQDDVGSLASYAIEIDKRIHGLWDFSAMALNQLPAAAADVFRLAAEEPDPADVILQLLELCIGEVVG